MAARELATASSVPLRHGSLRTPDGADLAVYEAGGGPGPTIILVGGICGDVDAFRLLIEDFAPWHRIIAWDYRGLYASSDGISRDQRVERHALDLALVLDHFGVERAVAIGWSMGARVALECARVNPDRLLGLVALGGTFGQPFQRMLEPLLGPLAGAAPILLKAAEVAAMGVTTFPRLLQRIVRRALVLDALRLLGVVGETIDGRRFGELVADSARSAPAALTATLYALGEHCAEMGLPTVYVPVLLVTGNRDPFTTVEETQRAAAFMEAETTIIPSGTHFAMIEFPELVHLRIDAFMRQHMDFDRLGAL